VICVSNLLLTPTFFVSLVSVVVSLKVENNNRKPYSSNSIFVRCVVLVLVFLELGRNPKNRVLQSLLVDVRIVVVDSILVSIIGA